MTKKLLYILLLTSIFIVNISQAFSAVSNDQIQSWVENDKYLISSSPVRITTLDPIMSINAHSKFTLPLVFETLISINAQQELMPSLAESWLISTDRKTFTLNIKPNHRFSDNTEVTAQDVADSMYRLCSKRSQEYGQVRGLLGCEKAVKGVVKKPEIMVTGKYSIRFETTSSPTTFLYQLSSSSAGITKQTKDGLIGSGPYLLKRKENDYIILGKNPFYNGNISMNNSGIVMLYLDSHEVVERVSSNTIDCALMYEMSALDGLKSSNYKLIRTNPNITSTLVLNNQRFPFNEPEIRNAFAAEIYNGLNYACVPGAHKAYGVIPNGIAGSLANLMPDYLTTISPREIFIKYPQLENNEIPVIIHQLSDLKNSCISEQIVKAAKKYHINLKFKYHKDYSDLLPLYANHNLDGFIEFYVFKNREAYNILDFFAKNGANHANLEQDDMDKILKAAVSALTSHQRFQIYRKIAQYMQSNNIIVPLFYMDHGNLMNRCLIGISEDFNFNPFLELPKISRMNMCQKV